MLPFMLMILVTTSFRPSFGQDYGYDYANYDGPVENETLAFEYNDTLLESLMDSYYFRARNDRNWRYSFSEDMDTNNDGILSDKEKQEKLKSGMELVFRIIDKNNDLVVSKEEISSPSLDLNNAIELLNFYFDVSPDRYYWTYYDLMQMSWVDDDDDASLSIQEIENGLQLTTDSQKKIVEDLFHYFDENKDNKLTMDDLKPKLTPIMTMLFNVYDQNNDGSISLDDLDFKVQWEDVTTILDTIKANYMKSGEIDLNHFLIPFDLDLNGDDIMNNFDLYLSVSSNYMYPTVGYVSKVLKLLDQDQDGVYKFDDIKNFVVTVWTILDANHDMTLSFEDGYLLLKDKLNVANDKISALESYVNYAKTFVRKESVKLTEYVLNTIDRNGDDEVTMEEFYQMPEMCISRWRDESCFKPRQFPEPPRSINPDEFFPQSKYVRIPTYRMVEQRLIAFVLSILDSPKFNNVKEFDWAGAAEIEEKIEDLAPRGEALLDELRHKISAYKQVLSYLNKKE